MILGKREKSTHGEVTSMLNTMGKKKGTLKAENLGKFHLI